MARRKKAKKSAPKPRNPFAWALAAKTGSAAGKHKSGRKRPKGEGTRSQKRAKAIREW